MNVQHEVIVARAVAHAVQSHKSQTHVIVGDHPPEKRVEHRPEPCPQRATDWCVYPRCSCAMTDRERLGITTHNMELRPGAWATGYLIDGTKAYYRGR